MGRGEVCFQIIREVETCNFLREEDWGREGVEEQERIV